MIELYKIWGKEFAANPQNSDVTIFENNTSPGQVKC